MYASSIHKDVGFMRMEYPKSRFPPNPFLNYPPKIFTAKDSLKLGGGAWR